MRYLFFFAICFLFVSVANAQFWAGPKFGVQMTKHSYQSPKFTSRYKVKGDVNWHAGIALQYTTEQKFAVHTELVFQKVSNNVQNDADTAVLNHTTNYSFVSTVMHGRYTVGYLGGATSLYIVAGPRLSYWLSGSGSYESQEAADNFGVPGGDFTVTFSDVSEGVGTGNFVITRPNRIQYGLDFGVGTILDLASGQRLNVEVRYSIGHSNMGFDQDLELVEGIEYKPSIEYANNMAVFSLSYLFGYNPNDRRKGSSTNKLSNGARKKR